MRHSMVRFLFAAGAALLVLAGGCGDDPPNGPVTPGNQVIGLNGVRFKGFMGSDSTTVQPLFTVTDAEGNRLANTQIQIEPVVGDGSLMRSITTDGAGVAVLKYGFTGQMGHATLRLYADGTDTLEVYFRAHAIIPGVHGQVSYVLFDDDYAEVKRWLGEPESEDVEPGRSPIYADYEEINGLVVLLYDLDLDGGFYDTSSVLGVFVTPGSDVQTLTTPPLGIGTTIDQWQGVYGQQDSKIPAVVADEWEYHWERYDMIVWGGIDPGPDTTVTQISCQENAIYPKEIVALNGVNFRVMNVSGGLLYPAAQFAVEDSSGFKIGGVDIKLSTVVGGGSFLTTTGAPTSRVMTDSTTGVAEFRYSLPAGPTGHAVGRLTIPSVDSVDVNLRTNVLVAGAGGQGQYVMFDETYAEVMDWNGAAQAAALDGPLGTAFVYAGYPDSGVTFVFDDPGGSDLLRPESEVHGVVVEAPWPGNVASSAIAERVKIGWTLTQLVDGYGPVTDSVTVGDTLRVTYNALPARFDLLGGTIFRIVTWEGR